MAGSDDKIMMRQRAAWWIGWSDRQGRKRRICMELHFQVKEEDNHPSWLLQRKDTS